MFTYASGTWQTTPVEDLRFVYEGWNVVMVLDGLELESPMQPYASILKRYTWGLDLSGTRQGAGGIGGLLAVDDTNGTTDPVVHTAYLFAYDTNGNVGQLVDAGGR